METLPVDIEQKLEKLPIVPFDGSQEFQEVIFSNDFNDIFEFYSNNYMPDIVKARPELYQRISLYLTLTNQDTSVTEQIDEALYRRPVPTIDEFLTGRFFSYNANSTLYPYWKEKLKEIFRENSPVRKAIFTGSIGCLAKDTIVVTLRGNKTIGELLNNFEDEWVLSYNTDNNSWEPDKVINVFFSGVKDVYDITLDNGKVIRCTADHKFLNRKNHWVNIDNGLEIGMSMLTYCYDPNSSAKENRKVVSIEYAGKQEVFDITTERNHNFCLDAGIVAHNCGKSTVARKAFLYVLYRLFCFRNLRAVLNVDQDSTIANVVISMTLKQVYETNTIAFIKLMDTMPCFQKVMSQRSFENFNLDDPRCPIPYTAEKSTGNLYFPDNIILTCGSNSGHFTGYNVVNSFCDEISEKGVAEAISLLNSLDSRFSSRFSGVDIVFQSIVSSAKSENSAMGEYLRHLPKNDPSIVKYAPCLWDVKPDPEFKGDGSTFPVMVGNGTIPSKIITDPGELKAIEEDNFEPPAGCVLIHAPTMYRTKFELQLDQSIQDLAGMTTSDNNMVFRDTTKLEDQSLNPEFNLEVNVGNNTNVLDLLEPYDLFEQDVNSRWQFKRSPKANRYIHCDLAGGGSEGQCDAAVCILHKEYQKNSVTKLNETVFVVDLLLFINAKTKVDIRAIQNFLTDLVIEKNIPVHTVSADQWQSLMFLQSLEASGCFTKVDKLSVDMKLEPYTNTATLMEQGLVKLGKCPKLRKELESLILNKNKVERTVELKDGADAIVGAIWNAQLNYNDVPSYEYVPANSERASLIFSYEDLIDTSCEELLDL